MGCEDEVKESLKKAVDLFTDLGEFLLYTIDPVLTQIMKETGKKVTEELFNALGYEDEDIFFVQSLSSRLVNTIPPSPLKGALLDALINDKDILKNILATATSSLNRNLEKYYKYGRDSYVYGLPTAIFNYKVYKYDELKAILESQLGESITITRNDFKYPTIEDLAESYIQNLYPNYNYTTKTGVYNSSNNSFQSAAYDQSIDSIAITVYDSFNEQERVIHIPFPNITSNYFVVIYYKDSDPSSEKIWLYDSSLELYPSLIPEDNSAYTNSVPVFPIVPLRQEYVNINNNIGSVEYQSAKTLLDFISIDIEEIISSITSNESIDNVQDAFLLSAINLYTQSQLGIKFLYDIFKNFYYNMRYDSTEYTTAAGRNLPFTAYIINAQEYNIAIKFNYITYTDVVGSIGDLGVYTNSHTVVTPLPYDSEDYDQDGGEQSYIIIRYQYSETNYYELFIHGLVSTTYIDTGDSGSFKTYINKISDNSTEQNAFNIPLPYEILEDYKFQDREAIFLESLIITFYAEDAVHLRYYETSSFQALVEFAITVIQIIFFITGDYAGTTVKILLELNKKYLLKEIIRRIFVELLEEAGDDKGKQTLAVLFYVVASVYAGGKFDDLSSFIDSLSDLESAIETMNVVVEAYSTVEQQESIRLNNEMALLEQEQSAFNEWYDSESDKFDNAYMALNNRIDPTEVRDTVPSNLHNESRDQFLARTSVKNPGKLIVESLSSFADNSLKINRNTPIFEDLV